MSAKKPEDQANKQTSSNKDAEKEIKDFDPDGQNSKRRDQRDSQEAFTGDPEARKQS